MAVTDTKSTQLDSERKDVRDDHAKTRSQYFEVTQGAAAGDAGSTVQLCDLPAGPVRILPYGSIIQYSALGASRTLDVGFKQYNKGVGLEQAEEEDALIDGLDVSSAGLAAFNAAVLKHDVYSTSGIRVFGTIKGGTIPAGATISGIVQYVYE